VEQSIILQLLIQVLDHLKLNINDSNSTPHTKASNKDFMMERLNSYVQENF
jgi:hypothetical protein